MKLVKLSLSAIIALSTSAFAVDTVADAFKNAKVSGAVQAAYWDRNDGASKDGDIMNFGLDVSYETASFYNFGLKATLQTSSSPFIDADARTAYANDMHGSGSRLSELFLSYDLGETKAQAGRMYFATPLVYGSGSRMNRESFEGAVVTNTSIQDTKLTLGYVQKVQNRTDGKGNIGEFNKIDGAYTAVIENSSIQNVNLAVAYLDAQNLKEVAYLEAAYKKDNLGLSSQYYYSETEGVDSTDLFGLKGKVNIDKVSVEAAYTTTGDQDVNPGVGNGADYAYTGSPILSNSYAKNTDAYKVGAGYKVTPVFNVGMNYVIEDSKTKDYSYTSITADYTVSGVNVAVLYDEAGKDSDDKEFRLNVNYPF